MPQMSPLSWVTLMLLLLLVYLLNTIKLYFNNVWSSPSISNSTPATMNQYQWKW